MTTSTDHGEGFISEIDESTIPMSFLDTDLYKITMQCAVFHQFPTSECTYRFTNRSPDMMFSRECFDWCKERVMELANIRLDPAELKYLQLKLPYLTQPYLDFLSNLRLDPSNQVDMTFIPKERPQNESHNDVVEFGEIAINIKGLWKECILYEVPLMYILCEGYFKIDDTDWKEDHHAIRAQAKAKSLRLLSTLPNDPLLFSEFGTRRRRSYKIQEEVLRGLIDGDQEWKANGGVGGGGLAGTSNVYLAMKYGLKPIGTIAHEWIMAIAAKEEYKNPNGKAMDLWEEVYPASPTSPLHTMLTDTFTMREFFYEFQSDPARALRWNGLRHDSGDPISFAKLARESWVLAGAELIAKSKPKGRRVVFSDGLDVDEALRIARKCERIGVDASFGIGTNFTNDFVRASSPSLQSQPLNIVIKIHTIDGLDCVKLTDDKGKYTGEKREVERVRLLLGLPR